MKTSKYVECSNCKGHHLRLLETEFVCVDCGEELELVDVQLQLNEGRVLAR